ncbi:hypothetical protein SAY86_015084 [Trapa natans]|uniref:Uncharacterized protein n=1 Tax=Trapa natans TaxID=22666 RepID=A0AAN7KH71_TRANT|nr:hypothetical protein SAY86_015084 [Trapa natans]
MSARANKKLHMLCNPLAAIRKINRLIYEIYRSGLRVQTPKWVSRSSIRIGRGRGSIPEPVRPVMESKKTL